MTEVVNLSQGVPRWGRAIKGRHLLGTVLFLAGMGMIIWLGVLSVAEEQPTNSTSTLLVVLAAVLQGGSTVAFKGAGAADPSLARASVRRLIRLAQRSDAAVRLAEHAFETGSEAEMRTALGRLSAELGYLQEGFVEAIEDWQEFHRDALRDIGGGIQGNGGSN